jgi:hypothetical protein
LIGSRDHVRDLRYEDTEKIAGIRADLKVLVYHRQDAVTARLGLLERFLRDLVRLDRAA